MKKSKQMSNNVNNAKKPSIKSLKIKERIETMARDYNLPVPIERYVVVKSKKAKSLESKNEIITVQYNQNSDNSKTIDKNIAVDLNSIFNGFKSESISILSFSSISDDSYYVDDDDDESTLFESYQNETKSELNQNVFILDEVIYFYDFVLQVKFNKKLN